MPCLAIKSAPYGRIHEESVFTANSVGCSTIHMSTANGMASNGPPMTKLKHISSFLTQTAVQCIFFAKKGAIKDIHTYVVMSTPQTARDAGTGERAVGATYPPPTWKLWWRGAAHPNLDCQCRSLLFLFTFARTLGPLPSPKK